MGVPSTRNQRFLHRIAKPSRAAPVREPVPWHTQTAEAVLRELKSDRDGLGEEEAAVRLAAYGPNALPEGKRRGPLPLLAHLVASPFVLILVGAAVVAIGVNHYLTAFVTIVAVAVNVVIGFMQEFKAERALNSLRNLHAPKAVAFRDGVPRSIAASDLVPGDVVLFWDRANQHKGPEIDRVLRDHPRLRIEPLPPYGFDFNADEGVWDHVKWIQLPNFTPRDVGEQVRGYRRALRRLQRRPDLIASFFERTALPRRDIRMLLDQSRNP